MYEELDSHIWFQARQVLSENVHQFCTAVYEDDGHVPRMMEDSFSDSQQSVGRLLDHGTANCSDSDYKLLYIYCKSCEDLLRQALANHESPALFDVQSADVTYRPFPLSSRLLRSAGHSPEKLHEGFVGGPFSGFGLELALTVRWVPIDGAFFVDHDDIPVTELDWGLREGRDLVCGIAPFVDSAEFDFKFEGGYIRASDFRNEKEVGDGLEEVVRAAVYSEVRILVFPELTMSPAMRERLTSSLRLHNKKMVVRMVVAGSWHDDAGEDGCFTNTSRVMDAFGQELWSQSKTLPFTVRKDGSNYREPKTLGDRFVVRESAALGRVGLAICSDFCNSDAGAAKAPLWGLIEGCNLGLLCVPALQNDGNLDKFANRAKQIAELYWGCTIVCNIDPKKESPKEVGGGGAEAPAEGFARTGEQGSGALIRGQGVAESDRLRIIRLTPVSSAAVAAHKTCSP